jgi:hypothetical protein
MILCHSKAHALRFASWILEMPVMMKRNSQPPLPFAACLIAHSLRFSLNQRLRTKCLAGLIFLSFCAVSITAQNLKFKSPVTYPAGSPYVITSGDLNGDGKIDLIAGDVQHNDVVVVLGKGDGSFQAPLTFHMVAAPYYLLAADFNRDGRLDVIADNPDAGNISVLFGKGDGSFQPPVNYTVGGGRPYQIRTADFNRDGWLDLAMFGAGPSVYLLLNNGDGTFRSGGVYPVVQSAALATADVNGDGKVDVIVGMRTESNHQIIKTVSVLLGNGDGTLKSPINTDASTIQTSTGPYAISMGDFDRDGKIDIALSDEFLKIMKGNGDGTFKPPAFFFHLRNTSTDLKAGDFNGDGKLDLVTTGVFGTGALEVLLGSGDGTFQDAGDQVSGASCVSVVVSDLNNDTRPDLAANIGGQLTVALVNETPGNIVNTDYFVHQQYVDFLEREPDASGFEFWSNEITKCGADPACQETKRINVSAAFYLSIEFQQTAYLVERLYKVSYGDATGSSSTNGTHQLSVPIVRLSDLLSDTQQISEGVVVHETDWSTVLESNKQLFVNQFVRRARFTAAFPTSLTPAEFVDQLNQHTGDLLSGSDKAAAVALFAGATDSSSPLARAQALRQIAENANLYRAEFNRAFVLMEYFGYLRRNPNEGRDSDYSGYEFWLNKLNAANGNFINAEMVKAFITSDEYMNRFTQ